LVVQEAFAQFVVVDPVDDHDVGVAAGRGDQHLLGAAFQVFGGGFALGEQAGALEHDVDAELAPGQVGRIALGQHLDFPGADLDRVFGRGDLAGEGSVHRIVGEQVGVGFRRAQIVDRHELDVLALGLHRRA
jgi:hypothetical protein